MQKVKLTIDGAYILSFQKSMSIEDKIKNCSLLAGSMSNIFTDCTVKNIKNKVVIYLTPVPSEIPSNYDKIKSNIPQSFYMDNFITFN